MRSWWAARRASSRCSRACGATRGARRGSAALAWARSPAAAPAHSRPELRAARFCLPRAARASSTCSTRSAPVTPWQCRTALHSGSPSAVLRRPLSVHRLSCSAARAARTANARAPVQTPTQRSWPAEHQHSAHAGRLYGRGAARAGHNGWCGRAIQRDVRRRRPLESRAALAMVRRCLRGGSNCSNLLETIDRRLMRLRRAPCRVGTSGSPSAAC